jgi:hypothetical protein
MKKLFLVSALFFSLNCFSQILFEKGYFVTNANEKIICLIKNHGWKNNPTEFEYKLSESGETKLATIKNVKEFELAGLVKFVRSAVDIEKSSDRIFNLDKSKKLAFKNEEIFLKVLIEGKGTLYEYRTDNFQKFFFSNDGSKVSQLIYKKYLTSENKVGVNSQFRQQLLNSFYCESVTQKNIERIEFAKNSLLAFFKLYNDCEKSNTTNYEKKNNEDAFNLSIRPRLINSSLSIFISEGSSRNTDFDSQIGFGIGIEAEFILPFKENKWSLFIEPTYQKYTSEKTTSINDGTGAQSVASVNYTSIELHFGGRHYFFLNNHSKLFLNASVVVDFNNDSQIEIQRTDNPSTTILDLSSAPNLGLGLGYNFKSFSLEIRYQSNRNVLNKFTSWNSDYKTVSFIVGYSLF